MWKLRCILVILAILAIPVFSGGTVYGAEDTGIVVAKGDPILITLEDRHDPVQVLTFGRHYCGYGTHPPGENGTFRYYLPGEVTSQFESGPLYIVVQDADNYTSKAEIALNNDDCILSDSPGISSHAGIKGPARPDLAVVIERISRGLRSMENAPDQQTFLYLIEEPFLRFDNLKGVIILPGSQNHETIISGTTNLAVGSKIVFFVRDTVTGTEVLNTTGKIQEGDDDNVWIFTFNTEKWNNGEYVVTVSQTGENGSGSSSALLDVYPLGKT